MSSFVDWQFLPCSSERVVARRAFDLFQPGFGVFWWPGGRRVGSRYRNGFHMAVLHPRPCAVFTGCAEIGIQRGVYSSLRAAAWWVLDELRMTFQPAESEQQFCERMIAVFKREFRDHHRRRFAA